MKLYQAQLLIILIVVMTTNCFMTMAKAAQESLTIDIQTAEDLPIKKSLLELAKEIEETAKIYQTGNQIAYWENEAKKSFYKLLHSQGYYSSSIDVEINSKKANSIIFHINSWQRYTIDNVTIKHTPESNKDILMLDVNSLKLKSTQFAVYEDILIAQKKFTEIYRKQ